MSDSAPDINPPSKTRKRKLKDTSRPEVSIEMAEGVNNKETEDRPRVGRQCNLDDIPYDLLSPEIKQQVDEIVNETEKEALKKKKEEEANIDRARTILGVFLGAGLGFFLAYTARNHIKRFFAVAEKVAEIVDE
jgi:hypothetical protein